MWSVKNIRWSHFFHIIKTSNHFQSKMRAGTQMTWCICHPDKKKEVHALCEPLITIHFGFSGFNLSWHPFFLGFWGIKFKWDVRERREFSHEDATHFWTRQSRGGEERAVLESGGRDESILVKREGAGSLWQLARVFRSLSMNSWIICSFYDFLTDYSCPIKFLISCFFQLLMPKKKKKV